MYSVIVGSPFVLNLLYPHFVCVNIIKFLIKFRVNKQIISMLEWRQ